MARTRRRKCKHCRDLFIPDHRNRNKQRYCSKPDCRKASKAASQKKWQEKEENKNYHSGPENVRRVQQWRKKNPGYWKQPKLKQGPLQDHLPGNNEEKQEDNQKLTKTPLQDLLTHYPAVIVGLLSHLSGSALQDDIVETTLRLQQLGRDILTDPITAKGGHNDGRQTAHLFTSGPQSS